MKALSAKDAKNRFGELMDTVQREPVSIEKHGRPVAVVLSEVAYEKMKLEHLQAMLAVGEAQLDRGEGIDGEEFFEELRQGIYD
ncbi:MAG TPA: type II toxin-antitoxin system Phd/YefM family antitoxin [Gammaproteobacteria bacterium]|nr:type II toxin-antitoxin system Phd/YefM family antitoxin [Gammaproteobacteria bacterium]